VARTVHVTHVNPVRADVLAKNVQTVSNASYAVTAGAPIARRALVPADSVQTRTVKNAPCAEIADAVTKPSAGRTVTVLSVKDAEHAIILSAVRRVYAVKKAPVV